MQALIHRIDQKVIGCARRINVWFAREALFVVYFWFGVIKLFGTSPANPLVSELLGKTLPFLTFDQFIIILGVVEMLIGVMFLIPRMERMAIMLLVVHMVTTIVPLILLPAITWQLPFVPTLEGQYIIKNILIVALAIVIASTVRPMGDKGERPPVIRRGKLFAPTESL